MNRAVTVAAGLLMTLAVSGVLAAEDKYPSRPVRFIAPFVPGGPSDILSRLMSAKLSESMGQQFVVDNRGSAGGIVGIEIAAKAPPDGYTLLLSANSLLTINPHVYKKIPYDPVRDFAAITPLGTLPMVLVISPDKNVKTLQDLVAAAKAKPGSLNYAAAGIGTPPHLTMERFRMAAGFQGQLVPFKSAPEALTEVMTGRVDVYFCPLPPAIALIREGKLKALAVSNPRRAAALPDVPTTIEAGFPDSDFDFWVGMFVPKQTPRDVVAKMHQETAKALQSAEVKERLGKLGVETAIMQPEDFDARIAKETAIAEQLAKAAGITQH